MNSKPIEGFDDNYIIYEDGSVFNKKFNRFIKSNLSKRKDIELDKCYYQHTLCKNGKKYIKRLHRLLAIAFIPNPDNLPCVDHIDRNPQNNDIENLRWVNHSTNRFNCGVNINNKLGEKYIYKTKNNTYRFQITKYKKNIISKRFNTLEDAIKFRNEWIKENPIYSL